MSSVMMKCGHAANGRTAGTLEPVCLICGVTEIVPSPILEGRKARCSYGCESSITASRIDLPFFEIKPAEHYDKYYCGCYGWD